MKQKMKKWEYLTVNNADKNKLNELGINGWELVSVVFTSKYNFLVFYFKKQVVS